MTHLGELVRLAPPELTLDHDVQRGWVVGQIGTQYCIWFTDRSRPIYGTDAVIDFIETHTHHRRSTTMPLQAANYYDERALEAVPQLHPYLYPTFEYMVGQDIPVDTAPVLKQKRLAEKRSNWLRLIRNAQVVKPLTLDAEPETPGRPRNFRPDTTMLVWIWLPDAHPFTKHGPIALMVYEPSQTRMLEGTDNRTGAPELVPIASMEESSGVIGIIGYRDQMEDVEEERALIRQWLVDFSNAAASDRDPDDEEDDGEDPQPAYLSDPESW